MRFDHEKEPKVCVQSSAVGARLDTPTAYKVTPMIITTKREGRRCNNILLHQSFGSFVHFLWGMAGNKVLQLLSPCFGVGEHGTPAGCLLEVDRQLCTHVSPVIGAVNTANGRLPCSLISIP